MSDTPRTDEFGGPYIHADFARQLERELNEAIRQRDLYLKDRDIVMVQRDQLRADKERLDWLDDHSITQYLVKADFTLSLRQNIDAAMKGDAK